MVVAVGILLVQTFKRYQMWPNFTTYAIEFAKRKDFERAQSFKNVTFSDIGWADKVLQFHAPEERNSFELKLIANHIPYAIRK